MTSDEKKYDPAIPTVVPGCPSCAAGWYPDGSKFADKLFGKRKAKKEQSTPESKKD